MVSFEPNRFLQRFSIARNPENFDLADNKRTNLGLIQRKIAVVQLISFFTWPAMVAYMLFLPKTVQAQTPAAGSTQVQPTNLNTLSPSAPAGSSFSLKGSQQLMAEAESAISAQNYTLAIKKLQEARQVSNQLSNSYQELSASFLGVDNEASSRLRGKALETAQMRDQATYQLALVYRAQNQPQQAVPLLVQIIRSQQPTRDLGQKAYRQLLELGFVDVPYPNPKQPSNPSPAPKPPAQATPQPPAQ